MGSTRAPSAVPHHARGAEMTGGSHSFLDLTALDLTALDLTTLDLTALGRQGDREEPKGRAEAVRKAIPNFAI